MMKRLQYGDMGLSTRVWQRPSPFSALLSCHTHDVNSGPGLWPVPAIFVASEAQAKRSILHGAETLRRQRFFTGQTPCSSASASVRLSSFFTYGHLVPSSSSWHCCLPKASSSALLPPGMELGLGKRRLSAAFHRTACGHARCAMPMNGQGTRGPSAPSARDDRAKQA